MKPTMGLRVPALCGLRALVIAIDFVNSISGLVVEYIVAIDVTRARFPADALSVHALARLCDDALVSAPPTG